MSNVTDMAHMFSKAQSFDADISDWNVHSVEDMSAMFSSALSLNDDISKWDVSSVTNMDRMFKDATSFTQLLCGSVWVHSKASKEGIIDRTTKHVHYSCNTWFNGDIDQLDPEVYHDVWCWLVKFTMTYGVMPMLR